MNALFVSCAKGTEEALADELREIGAQNIKASMGGVHLEHENPLFYYDINLKSRIAFRVFKPIKTFPAASPEELYNEGMNIRWDRLFTKRQSFAVSAHVKNSAITNSHYAALKFKDAIADWFRNRFGDRPNVDTKKPHIQFNLFIDQNRSTLSLDTTGRSLHKRGYRTKRTAAPLMETLAATLIRLSEWDGKIPFYDLMCGSGTFGIEAALYANNTVPGLINDDFSFLKWKNFDETYFRSVQDECEEYEVMEDLTPIYSSDIDWNAKEIAQANARRAGVLEQMTFKKENILDSRPQSETGLIIINPPYGERIGDKKNLASLYNRLEQVLMQRYSGFRFCIFSPDETLFKHFRMRYTKRHIVYNAAIKCHFAIYDL